MASFQKTQDIDVLSVRKINARGDNNQTLPANSILTTDGRGGTNWINLSTINGGSAFNSISTSVSTFSASFGKTQFSILDGSNIGLIPTTGNSVSLYSKSFGQIDVPGQSSIYSFDNNVGTFNNTVQLIASGITNISTDTNSNRIFFNTPSDAICTFSTLLKNITQINTVLSSSTGSFNSPFSSFIYNELSSFSSSLGRTVQLPQMISSFSSFSTALGPTVQLPQMISSFSSFSISLGTTVRLTQMISSFSSFSTALGPTVQLPQMISSFSSFSTTLGPTVQVPQMISSFSSFSTSLGSIVRLPQMVTAFSSFSTALGPTITLAQINISFSTFSTALGPIVKLPQITTAFSSFSTALGPTVQLPQMISSFSSFSTSLGQVINNNTFQSTLSTYTTNSFFSKFIYTSSVTILGKKQPFIQCGFSNLSSGSCIITLSNVYINSLYSIQLTYQKGVSAPVVPISFSTITTSNFIVYGDSNATFHWTTFGNVF